MKRTFRNAAALAAALTATVCASHPAHAASASASMRVSLTIKPECAIASSAEDASPHARGGNELSVACTARTPHYVTLEDDLEPKPAPAVRWLADQHGASGTHYRLTHEAESHPGLAGEAPADGVATTIVF
jgi:spore coat protein U-like protein